MKNTVLELYILKCKILAKIYRILLKLAGIRTGKAIFSAVLAELLEYRNYDIYVHKVSQNLSGPKRHIAKPSFAIRKYLKLITKQRTARNSTHRTPTTAFFFLSVFHVCKDILSPASPSSPLSQNRTHSL